MKKKMYTTTQKIKTNKIVKKVEIDLTSIPNKMHLDSQILYPARVHEDKRFKKPKHKNKMFDE